MTTFFCLEGFELLSWYIIAAPHERGEQLLDACDHVETLWTVSFAEFVPARPATSNYQSVLSGPSDRNFFACSVLAFQRNSADSTSLCTRLVHHYIWLHVSD
jgi:hypothetical protein